MPRISVWFIRWALVHLVLEATLGTGLAVSSTWGWPLALAGLRSIHAEMLTV